MRVVLDPNTLVSSLLSTGTTAAVLDAWIEDRAYTPIVCPHLLAELGEVLKRDKFRRVREEVKRELIERLGTDGELFDDPPIEVGLTDDPDDDYLVALARESEADGIVSGDPHLRSASEIGIRVFTPVEFLDLLGEPTE